MERVCPATRLMVNNVIPDIGRWSWIIDYAETLIKPEIFKTYDSIVSGIILFSFFSFFGWPSSGIKTGHFKHRPQLMYAGFKCRLKYSPIHRFRLLRLHWKEVRTRKRAIVHLQVANDCIVPLLVSFADGPLQIQTEMLEQKMVRCDVVAEELEG